MPRLKVYTLCWYACPFKHLSGEQQQQCDFEDMSTTYMDTKDVSSISPRMYWQYFWLDFMCHKLMVSLLKNVAISGIPCSFGLICS